VVYCLLLFFLVVGGGLYLILTLLILLLLPLILALLLVNPVVDLFTGSLLDVGGVTDLPERLHMLRLFASDVGLALLGFVVFGGVAALFVEGHARLQLGHLLLVHEHRALVVDLV